MNFLLLLMFVFSSFIFSQCECEEPINTWFKYSNDKNDKTYNTLVTLDMSSGYADTDGFIVYIVVKDYNTNEWVTIGFPIGYWEAYIPDNEDKKDYINLEDYLKSLNNNGTKIEKK